MGLCNDEALRSSFDLSPHSRQSLGPTSQLLLRESKPLERQWLIRLGERVGVEGGLPTVGVSWRLDGELSQLFQDVWADRVPASLGKLVGGVVDGALDGDQSCPVEVLVKVQQLFLVELISLLLVLICAAITSLLILACSFIARGRWAERSQQPWPDVQNLSLHL